MTEPDHPRVTELEATMKRLGGWRGWLPGLTLDSSHLLVGWQKDGWKGPHLQWEFGAYINFDLAWSERHDYRWTYNYREWRTNHLTKTPLPAFKFER